jgi:hypothetical protein
VNRIGRRTIIAMLLIAALAVIWNLLGPLIGNERGRQLRQSYLRGRFSSFDNSARKSVSARFPANWAAKSD